MCPGFWNTLHFKDTYLYPLPSPSIDLKTLTYRYDYIKCRTANFYSQTLDFEQASLAFM